MFGWFKKRVLAKMNTLAYVANMATAFAVLEHVRSKSNSSQQATDIETMKASAITNYLFGKPPSEIHRQQLDLTREHKAALEWLRQDATFRELVVQSLRVMNTANSGRGNGASVLGEEILSVFGSAYPATPDPSSYGELVTRAICALPVDAQMQVSQWAKSQAR